MSVGVHFGKGDWDSRAYALFQAYRAFCTQAQELAGYLAPLSDQDVSDRTGYTLAEVADLKSGVNVANSLRQLSEGSADGTVLTQARQVSVLTAKFGGA